MVTRTGRFLCVAWFYFCPKPFHVCCVGSDSMIACLPFQLERATATNAATGRDEPADYRISKRY